LTADNPKQKREGQSYKALSFQEKMALVRRLLRELLAPRKGLLIFGLFWIVMTALLTALVAWLTRSLIDSVFLSNDQSAIYASGIAIGLVFVVKGIAEYLSAVAMGRLRTSMISELQMRLFRNTIHSRMGRLRATSAAKRATIINRFATASSSLVMLVSSSLVKSLLTVLFLAAVMIYQQPLLSLAAILIAPVAIFALRRLNRQISDLAKNEDMVEGAVIATIAEPIDGIAVVKSFQIEGQVTQSVRKAVKHREERLNALNRIMATNSPVMETLGGLVIVLTILYAGMNVAASGQTPGDIASFIIAFLLAYAPAKKLSAFNLQLTRFSRPASMMYRQLDNAKLEELGFDGDKPTKIDNQAGSNGVALAFEKVGYSYSRGVPALKQVSFKIEPGETVAIVGRSGSGKTTIARLLLGFETLRRGRIEIGGRPISELSLAELRQ